MWQSLGKMGFCPYFLKYLVQCFYFETIKHHVFVLKLDLKKQLNYRWNLTVVISGFMHILTLFFFFLVENLSET